uniref:Anaphase-promoting complex subunit 4 WD40 domain-containing protein n=1 Tax=Cuerna arida TaxID=1464854 RepID=A0A1B6G4E3_9HEMI
MLSQSEASRMKPYVRADRSFFAEAFERLKERRQTLMVEPVPGRFGRRRVSGTIQYFRDDFGGVTCVRFSADGNRIAVGFNSGELQVCKPALIDMRAGGQTMLAGWEGNHSISCVKFHPKKPELLYASSTDGTVRRKDIMGTTKYEDVFITEKHNEIYSFDFDAGGTKLITGGRDASIRVYDLTTKKLWKEYSRNQQSDISISPSFYSELSSASEEAQRMHHRKRVYCVRNLPEDFNIFVSGGWDCIVKIWDIRVPSGCVRDIDGPYIFGEAIDICQGKLLSASCQASNTLALWDIGSGTLISDIVPTNKGVYLYGEYPYAAQFYRGDPTGDIILCGGSGLGGLQVISIRKESIIYVFEDEKPVVTVDSTDNNIAFGGKSNTVFFGNLYAQEKSSLFAIRAYSQETNVSSITE